MIIRNEQMGALDRYMRESFRERMEHHLKSHFPESCADLGDNRLRDLIEEGIAASASYGIRKECDVCRYLDVMLATGPRFDREHSWAANLLRSNGNSSRRTGLLLAAAQKYLTERGPADERVRCKRGSN